MSENLFITRMVGSNTYLRLTQFCFGVKPIIRQMATLTQRTLRQMQVHGSTHNPSSDGFSPIPTYQGDYAIIVSN